MVYISHFFLGIIYKVSGVLRIKHNGGHLKVVDRVSQTPIQVKHTPCISFDKTGRTLLTLDRFVRPFLDFSELSVNLICSNLVYHNSVNVGRLEGILFE